jgi:hypothetical protein
MTQALILGMLGSLGSIEIIFILGIVSFIIPRIFYLLTLQKTLEKIDTERRTMPSVNVWLELIPLFNLVWQFINVVNVSNSLKRELEFKGIKIDEQRPGYSIGIAFCVLSCCSVIPFLGILTGIASVVCWIIFWVKVSNYKNML